MGIFNKKNKKAEVINKLKFTLLSDESIIGDEQLEIFKKMGTKAAVTDHAILTGAYVSVSYHVDDDSSLKGRCGWWWAKTPLETDGNGARVVLDDGFSIWDIASIRSNGVRPALPYSSISEISPNGVRSTNKKGIEEVEVGNYPRWAVNKEIQELLSEKLKRGELHETNIPNTSDLARLGEKINLGRNKIYEYNGKLYALVKANSYSEKFTLSNGIVYKRGDLVWEELEPVIMYNDKQAKMLVPKEIILGGIPFNHSGKYDGNFEETDLYKFMNEHLLEEIMYSTPLMDKNESTNLSSDINYLNNDNDLDQDIKRLLDSIELLLNNVPNETRNVITEKINTLLNNYILVKKELKPSFARKRNILELPDSDLNSIKINLLADLEVIKLNLSSNEILNFLKRLSNYKSLIKDPQKDMNKKDKEETIIKETLDLINSLDENKKNKYTSLLNNYIEIPIKRANDELKETKSNNLYINYENNVRDFKNNVYELYDKLKILEEKYNLLKSLSDCFNNSVIEISKPEKDDLVNDIISINYIISKISNEKYRKILSNDYNNIKEKYLHNIKKIIDDDELLIKSNYEDIEIDIRKDINSFLEKNKDYIYSDEYESKNANKEKLKNELEKAIEYIENNNVEDNNSNIIVSLINDIFDLLNQNLAFIEDNDFKEIKDTIKTELNESLKKIKDKEIDNFEKYNTELKNILSKVAKVKMDVITFINEKKRYYDVINAKNK